ncbi:gdp-fucose transporter 1-like [Dermatophagoides farinae]|uniref:Gdp-fucose transporter 1-like n=1 Tax=Dermatophagoides farinae TaxID=6954 RepID=A0A9D4P5Z0_DERFA|nr:gdp-fucose transporter 1-like [Dermatophagoides farinae]
MTGYSRLAQEPTETDKVSSETLCSKYIRIATVVAFYWFVSITMVFLNKQALNQVNAPFFITWFQCLVTGVMLFTFRVLDDWRSSKWMNNKCQESLISDNGVIKYCPLSVVFVAMISFNNLSLQFVGIAFYFVVRSLTPVFNVLFSYIILHKKTSVRSILCCMGIIFGFAMGVDQEQALGTLSAIGVLCGVLASMFVSLNSIFVASMLKVVDQNVALLSYYNSIIAVVLFIPFIMMNNEWHMIIAHLGDHHFWLIMATTGIFGLFISIVTNLQIQYTSPLTHNISGTAKACSQTILATYVYEQHKTFNWWLSNVIVLASSTMYTFVRQQEMKHTFQQHQQPPVNETRTDPEKGQTNI